MSGVLEYAARLSQAIGARPGGTEEEQQASFIIEETFKSDGLETSVEEFNCNPNYELPRIICCIVSIVLAVLAMFLPLLLVPALVVCAAMAALFVMEVVGISPLNNMAKRGISQNVVAKYIPGETGFDAGSTGSLSPIDDVIDVDATAEEVEAAEAGKRTRSRSQGRQKGARKRKIIIVARYDSGKVCRELNQPVFKVLDIIHWVEIVGIALIPVVILLRLVTNAEGGLLVFWNVLIAVGVVCTFLPVLSYILHQTAPYTDGANNNASGVAVMLEVAGRLAEGAREASQASAELEAANAEGAEADGLPVMHGEAALRESDMLPEGAEVVYHDPAGLEGLQPEGAALLGQPDAGAADAAQPDGPAAAALLAGGRAAGDPGASVPDGANAPESPSPFATKPMEKADPNVPAWFRKGIQAANANKEASGLKQEANIHRSRFADALDAAAIASAHSIEEFEAREREAAQAKGMAGESARTASGIDEERLRQARASILGGGSVAAKAEVAAVVAEKAASEAEAAKQAAEKASAQAAAKAAQNKGLTPEEAVSKAGGTLQADVAAAIGAQQAEQAAATAQAAEEVAEQAAVADRTISYIPVAADIPADISASEAADASVADSVGKSAADILEEASAIADASDSQSVEGGRRKRSISLPSLTGAIEGMNAKRQDAPLAADAERGEGVGRSALQERGRKVRNSLTSLPSTDLPSKSVRLNEPKAAPVVAGSPSGEAAAPSVSATVVSSKEGSTTSFLASAEQEAAKAALSSLDIPTSSSKTPKASPSVSVSAAGSFVAASSTSQFQPVGDELIADMVEEDIVIHDADDSDYAENVTLTGAMAGPGYVDMPKSRVSRIRGIFGRKKKQESDSISFSEAVGIDAGFDAREVGAARGGWESFQNESAGFDAGAAPEAAPDASADTRSRRSHADEYSTSMRLKRNRSEDWGGDAWSDDDWNGGAFSTLRDRVSNVIGEDGGNARGSRSVRAAGEDSARRGSSRRASGAGSGVQRRRSFEEVSASEADEFSETRVIGAEDMLDERERIRSFRTGSAPLASFEEVAAYAGAFSAGLVEDAEDVQSDAGSEAGQQPHGFQTEVWFVALGAELADNAGIKAFLAEHSDDLRGSIVIDLDAMGAGDLSLIEEEGVIRRVKASSRMKRYVTKAGTAIGLRVNSVKMNWRESAAYYINRKGLQTIHVAGMKDGKPAYQGEMADKFENLSEEKLLENTAFVLELLNTI